MVGMVVLGYIRAFLVVSPCDLVLVPRTWNVLLDCFTTESAVAQMTSSESVC